jgi:hypothetical protein
MCFGSKSKPDDTDTGPPVRQTEVKNPDLFRTPTFQQGKERRSSARRESHASGHSPSESLHLEEEMVSPGHAPTEQRYSTNEGADEAPPVTVATVVKGEETGTAGPETQRVVQ